MHMASPHPPKVNDFTVIVYVTCHDDASEDQARSLAGPRWKIDEDPHSATEIVRLPPSALMESSMYGILHERRDDWASADYVGLLTYSIAAKLEAFSRGVVGAGGWPGVRGNIAAAAPAPDVVGLFQVDFRKRSVGGAMTPVSMLEGAVFQHGMNFYRAWHALLSAMGYDEEAIVDPTVKGFFCNWWIVRPGCMRAYVDFYLRATHLVRESPHLRRLMEADAHYNGSLSPAQLGSLFGGRGFYTVMPFVFERLPAFFFHHHRPALRIIAGNPGFVMNLKE